MKLGLRRSAKSKRTDQIETIRAGLGDRPVVLVGMMGAGKTAIGRRLANQLDLVFCDADAEIEAAAGKTIADIFEEHGEAYFRTGERRVIRRLLGNGAQVLATGGGALMDKNTRAAIKSGGVSVWLNAAPEVLIKRVSKRGHRPLLKDRDVGKTIHRLLDERRDAYADADVEVESRDVPHDVIVGEIIEGLAVHFGYR